MKVKDAIYILTRLADDEEILFNFWSKDVYDSYDELNISDEVWNKVVFYIENSNCLDNPTDEIHESILDELRYLSEV